MRSAHISLLNHTKGMKWRNVIIWKVMMGVTIAKRTTIHVWRFVIYLINHPIAANLVVWRLDMKVLISVIHLNIVLFQAAKILLWYKFSPGIIKIMLVMRDIVLKNASWRGVLEAVATKITSMNWQVMNIFVVISMCHNKYELLKICLYV